MKQMSTYLVFSWLIFSTCLVFGDDTATPDFNTNPTNRIITPVKGQTESTQLADQSDCYQWTCNQLDWDPYRQYDILAEQGFAVALERSEWEKGLICLATEGAIAGAIAGEVVNRPGQGAAIGAAIGVTSGVIQLRYLLQVDDPKAQRAVRRYEKNLKKWETRFSGCMSRNGYRVHRSDQ